jgi:peptidoglycan biosynthesis protein MviN/MurJ (putative lipid II flippase)
VVDVGANATEGGPGTTARNSAIVAVCTLASRATGLLRVVVIGAVLGPTFFANAFQASYSVPNIVFTLIAGPVLSMVLVPSVVRAVGGGGLPRARQVFGRVTGWLLVVSSAVVAVLMLASPAIAWTLTIGIPDPAMRGRALWLTTLLVLFVAPQIPLYCLADLGMAAQRARGRFAFAAAAPAVENLGQVLTVAVAGWYYGAGPEVDRAPLSMVILLGAGCTGAVALHAALQLGAAARAGVLARPSLGWRRDAEATEVTRRLSRSVGVAACPALAMYALLALAASVPGGVFVVQMSYAVLFALSYLSARAVSMAALPGLARAAHQEDVTGFGSAWRQGLSYAVTASLPLLVLLAVLCGPTAHVLANGELSHSAVVGPLAACLAVVAVAQLVGGLGDLGSQALYARLVDRVPRRASALALGVTLAVALATVALPSGARLIGLVVAILAGELATAAVVLTRVRREIRPERFVDRRAVAGAALAAVAMAPVAGLTWWAQRAYAGGTAAVLAMLCLGGLLGLGVYALVLRGTLWRRLGTAR